MRASFIVLSQCCLLACVCTCNIASAQQSPVLSVDFENEEFSGGTGFGSLSVDRAAGLTAPLYSTMPEVNAALRFEKAGARVVWKDPGERSNYDFELGDEITLEAWVRLPKIGNGKHVYILSKGRTYESGRLENHNFALRLTGVNGTAAPSFLFSTAANNGPEYHRWTSTEGFGPGEEWHHVAVSYRFGAPGSLQAIVDGKQVTGKWDMGGATKLPPIVSDESVWLGSSRGGDPGNSLEGWIDNARIYRRILPAEQLKQQYRVNRQPPTFQPAAGEVVVTFHAGASTHTSFSLVPPEETMRATLPAMAIHRLPLRFDAGGIRKLWKGPVLMRMYLEREFADDEYELLLRSPGLSQLWIDGQVELSTGPRRLFPNAHQPMLVYETDIPWLRVPRVGDQETRATVKLPAGKHRFVLEAIVGSKTSRCETGETLVAFRKATSPQNDGHDPEAIFVVLTGSDAVLTGSDAGRTVELTDADFLELRGTTEELLSAIDTANLTATAQQTTSEWDEQAKRLALQHRKLSGRTNNARTNRERHAADKYALRRLLTSQVMDVRPAEPLAWLRRVSLDTRGIPPTVDEIEEYQSLPFETRKEIFVDRFLDSPRWADHWTSYWQDVLAENPSILKPSLNNTGPFRYWIHDALTLNKPMHRMVGELIHMQGDIQAGGPAGFGMAAQNDVPMAEKAHVLASAFLAVDLKCARCHDAPYHPWKQQQLFEMAAMLRETAIKVPATSSVPRAFFARHEDDAPISITLQPDDVVEPAFPKEILATERYFAPDDFPTRPGSSLADFASSRDALIQSLLASERFPQVLVNRMWDRMLGWGLVSSVDDWYDADVREPRLLEELADYFVETGFDAKALHRRILLSDIYSQAAVDSAEVENPYLAPWQRRMSAEQVVDSLHSVTGVEMSTEVISFDPEASQKLANFLNLGVARRAWQLVSLSNERDRPSLALPKAASIVECLEAFGWRASRQSPQTHRPQEANLVQPGVVANGHLTTTVTRMTAGSLLERLSLEADSPEALVDKLYMAVLTRKPTQGEATKFVGLISDGFDTRIRKQYAASPGPAPLHQGFVTWSNHFDVKANLLRRQQEKALADGPKPSGRIEGNWRRIAEDAVWALINSPEFQLVP